MAGFDHCGSGTILETSLTRRMALGGALAAIAAPGALAQGEGLELCISQVGHVILKATLNGERVEGLLDNGFSVSAMDLGHARRRGLDGAQATTINGSQTRRSVRVNVGFAGVTMPMWPPMLDLSDIPAPNGRSITLILGCDLLRAIILSLDFDALRGVAHRRSAERSRERSDMFPVEGRVAMRETDSGHEIGVIVEGRKLRAFLDLGAAAPLMVREGALTQGWRDGRKWSTSARATAHGAAMQVSERRVTRAKSLVVAGRQLRDVPVEVYSRGDRALGGFEAVIGAPALARFQVVMDLGGGRLGLAPGARLRARFAGPVVGARVSAVEAGLRVVYVAAGSPAEAAGLQAGEVVVAIDGAAPVRDRLLCAAAGEVIALQLADGAVRKVVAAEYY